MISALLDICICVNQETMLPFYVNHNWLNYVETAYENDDYHVYMDLQYVRILSLYVGNIWQYTLHFIIVCISIHLYTLKLKLYLFSILPGISNLLTPSRT